MEHVKREVTELCEHPGVEEAAHQRPHPHGDHAAVRLSQVTPAGVMEGLFLTNINFLFFLKIMNTPLPLPFSPQARSIENQKRHVSS